MPNRGTAQALNFALPEGRYVQPQVQQPVEQEAPVQALPSDIGNDSFAQVEGLTDKYYNLKGQIESFALGAQKK